MKGWRKKEPGNLDVPVERPRALRKMAELVFGNPIEYQRLADEVRLRVPMIKDVLECYDQAPLVAPGRDQSLKIVPFKDNIRKN